MGKKQIALILIAVLLLGMLAGCSGKTNGSQDASNSASGDNSSANGNTNGQTEQTTKFVYKPEYMQMKLPEGETFEWMGSSCISGGNIFFVTECIIGKNTGSYIDENGEEVTYEYDEYGTVLYRMDATTGVCTRMDCYQQPEPSEDGYSGSGINGLIAGADGTFWLEEYIYESIFDLPEDFDPETQERWDYWVEDRNSYRLIQYDAEGNELASREIGQEQASNLYTILLDSKGRAYGADWEKIYLFDEEGKPAGTIEGLESTELLQLSQDLICTSLWDSETGARTLKRINFETADLGEVIEVPADTWQFYPGFGEYDFVYQKNASVFGYSQATKASEKLFTWTDCDVVSSDVSNFIVQEDGTVLAFENYWNGTENVTNLIRLTQVDSSTLPQKQILTMACMWLDYDLNRQIVQFNKSSQDVRIVVQDYSEFNTQENYTAGLTQLSTEIMSGKVPDLLCTSELPISQYAAKGLLTDLWTLIDSDAELSRDDLMSEVFDAMSIDGKLYSLSKTFSIESVAGDSRLVGDEIGWTLEDLYRAREEMNPEASIFSQYDTKSGILYDCVMRNLDGFIDWNTGKCSFDSQEFIDMLKFADQFPLEYNWEEEYVDDLAIGVYYESDYQRIHSGKQMLLRSWMSDFSRFLYYRAIFDGNATFIGYPTASGNGNVFSVDSGIAISATCPNKEAAWSFVRKTLLKENQMENDYLYQFPTNRHAFEEMAKQAMTPEYATDENGQQIEIPKDTWWMDENTTIEVMAMTEEEYEAFMELYHSCKSVYSYNEEIAKIINEQVEAFFHGEKTAEETARLLQSRIGLLVAEKS